MRPLIFIITDYLIFFKNSLYIVEIREKICYNKRVSMSNLGLHIIIFIGE